MARALAGEPSRFEGARFKLLRSARMEEAFFDYSFSPVRDETGEVMGVLNIAVETTERLRAERQRAELDRALSESETRFRALVTAGSNSIYRMSPDWSQMYELDSRTLADTSGPIEDWPKKYLLEEDCARVFAAIENAIRTKSIFELEHRVRLADGSIGWVLSRAVPLLGPDGEIIEWFGTGTDVTERRRSLEKLYESEEWLRTVLEGIGEQFYVLDRDWRFLFVSLSALKIWGKRQENVLGHRFLDSFPEANGSDAYEAHCRVMRTRLAERFETISTVIGRWIEVDIAPTRDGGLSVAFRDIEARKRADAALRESEARFRQFSEASSDVLWIRNAETLEWEYLSPAFETIYGESRDKALDGDTLRHWLDLIVPADRELARTSMDRVKAGESVTFEYRITRPSDGAVRWLRDTDFPLRDASGHVQRIGGLGEDVTEGIENAGRMQVLVAELQHRTRNLIGVVRSIADRTLASSGSLGEFQERFRDRIGALARVNGLLSRLEDNDRISFDELLQAELVGHGVADGIGHGPTVTLEGPKGIRLRSATVQIFALGLHELTTNTLKHGALSRPEGQLLVRWCLVDGEDGGQRLRVEWQESGVPVPPPAQGRPYRRGSGRELIERSLPYQLGAETTYALTPEGVRCTITLPVSTTYQESADA